MPLRDIQENFKNTLLCYKSELPAGTSDFSKLFEPGGASFETRIAIYHNNVIGTQSRILAEKFPLLKLFLGEEYLLRCTRAYVIQNPPRNCDLNSYGCDLHTLLATLPELSGMKWLIPLTRAEEALFLCETLPDDHPVTAEEFQAIAQNINPDEQIMPLRAATVLLETEIHPPSVFAVFKTDTPSDEDLKSALSLCLSYTLFLRNSADVITVSLSHAEYKFLSTLKKLHSLSEAAEQALSIDPDFNIAEILQRHLALGIYVSHETKHEHLSE